MDNTKNNLEQKEKKGLLKKIIILVIILIVIFFIWFLNLPAPKESQTQQEWIDSLSQEDLEAIRSFGEGNSNIPTRTTPEQTYAALKEALKNEDVEAVANCFTEEKRETYKTAFIKGKKKNILIEIGEELPEELTEVYLYSEIAQYTYKQKLENDFIDHPISFIKDANGDWKIESL